MLVPHAPANDDDVLGTTGGFDCVLGNPPWEHVELKEIEWFSVRRPEIAKAENAAKRKKLIAALEEDDPALFVAFSNASRATEGQAEFARRSGRFPLSARGRVNTYALFAELNRSLMSGRGRVGCILPAGIATDDTTKEFFGSLVVKEELSSLYHFENEEFVFPTVHHSFRFCLLTLEHGGDPGHAVDMVFFSRQVAALLDRDRHVELSATDFLLFNPNSRTCPTFRSRRDAEINRAVYTKLAVLWKEGDRAGNPWGIQFMQGLFNMASDSGLFVDRGRCEADGYSLVGNVFERKEARRLPLYEAKMIHHFDHRFGTYEGQTEAQSKQGKCPEFTNADHADSNKLPLPYYWVDESSVSEQLEGRWSRSWLLGWRDICRTSDMRTVICSIMPRAAVGHTTPLILGDSFNGPQAAVLLAAMSSLVFDYCSRQKVGGTHLTFSYLKQLPIPSPASMLAPAPWSQNETATTWIRDRVIELVCTSHDVAGFAADCGYNGPPFRWDPARRAILRAELDAAFLHLYGVVRADAEHILDTFPVVRDKETREHGEYRSKRLILERYDALAEAITSRSAYRSPIEVMSAGPLPQEALPPAAGAWATPTGTKESDLALLALLEVLRHLSGPTNPERVRFAAIFVRKPALAVPFMDADTKIAWTTAIGREALPLPENVLDISRLKKGAPDDDWGAAVKRFIASKALVQDTTKDLWTVAPGLAKSGESWVEGRAAIAVRVALDLKLPQVQKQLAAFLKEVSGGATGRAVS